MGEGILIAKRTRIDNSTRQRTIEENKSIYDRLLASNIVDKKRPEQNYFSTKTGGFVLTYKGHNYHEEEVEAARIMADNGFVVRLFPESSGRLADVAPNGKFREGKIAKFYYEQKTPTSNSDNAMLKAVSHGDDKYATIGVIYDNKGLVSSKKLSKAISRFRNSSKRRGTLKEILVVVKSQNKVYSWLI